MPANRGLSPAHTPHEIAAEARPALSEPLVPAPHLDAQHAAFLAGWEYGEQIGYTRGRQDVIAEQLHGLAARVATLADSHLDERARSVVSRWWRGDAA